MGIDNSIKEALERLLPELRLSKPVTLKLVQQTESFSFAYLKELFLSSTMQWMTTKGSVSMDEIIVGQVALLRSQTGGSRKLLDGTQDNSHPD